jgi:hypothetical protein
MNNFLIFRIAHNGLMVQLFGTFSKELSKSHLKSIDPLFMGDPRVLDFLRVQNEVPAQKF